MLTTAAQNYLQSLYVLTSIQFQILSSTKSPSNLMVLADLFKEAKIPFCNYFFIQQVRVIGLFLKFLINSALHLFIRKTVLNSNNHLKQINKLYLLEPNSCKQKSYKVQIIFARAKFLQIKKLQSVNYI
ncbi:hypothetical protein ABPG72_013980 [Tetrahymena utriculariae]